MRDPVLPERGQCRTHILPIRICRPDLAENFSFGSFASRPRRPCVYNSEWLTCLAMGTPFSLLAHCLGVAEKLENRNRILLASSSYPPPLGQWQCHQDRRESPLYLIAIISRRKERQNPSNSKQIRQLGNVPSLFQGLR